jgi:chitin synthase
MYRLFSDDGRPLLSCDDVYQRYATNNVKTLHDKNLYHLGEDRMLTTLLLRYFPDMKLSFVPEATCYTIVPDKFSVLLSQRRRWINSTFHNMLELLRVNSLCGVCCLSMKSIVFLDLVATLILPASLIYVGYIIFITFWMGEPLSKLMLVVWGIVVGVQVVVFLLRSRWDYWWWFFVFVVAGVPVFYFLLPLYSFWHMDDLSWGTTRQVSGGGKGNLKNAPTSETDVESHWGFEVVGSKIINVDDFQSKAQRDGGAAGRSDKQQKARLAPALKKSGRQSQREQSDTRLNLMPKLNAPTSEPVDLDEVEIDDESKGCVIKFDRSKYKSAAEARKVRRERRGEC